MSFAMYRLMMTPRSPFARRIRIALLRLGQPFDQTELNVFEPTAEFLNANPLGLVPVLELQAPGGQVPTYLSDSAAILEHLDEVHTPGIWPKTPSERVRVRQWSNLATGIMTFTVSYFLETMRKQPDPSWKQECWDNIVRTLDRLSDESELIGATLNQGGLDLGVALEYLNLRIPSMGWPTLAPGLVPILDQCRTLQDFVETAPPPA